MILNVVYDKTFNLTLLQSTLFKNVITLENVLFFKYT